MSRTSRAIALGSLVAVCAAIPIALAAPPAPELPRLSVDTTYVAPSGRTIAVAAGGDFRAALNAAQPGDVITLEAGATFRGPFVLPNKAGAGWITVRTSAPESSLPPPGTRITPQHAAVMPKIEVGAGAGGAIQTAAGAHHFRFIGVEVRPVADAFVYGLVELGKAGETSETALPHSIVIDRSYIHGDRARGARRGITLNSKSTAVIDSHVSDFKEPGADSQAIGGWNGPGPFKLVNNYLEGAGENVMFGGADPTIANLVPSDIEIRRNHFSKPFEWKIGDPAYRGTPWTIKNLFELKNARRVLIEGNLFERSWLHAQTGFAIFLTVRNQDGRAPWSVVEDVTFVNNIVRHTAAGINVLGRDGNHPSQATKRILIRNNLFEDVGGSRWGGGGQLFQLLADTTDVVIEHNTAFQTGNIISADGQHLRFVYRNNITLHNDYGIIGTGTSGNSTLQKYFPGAMVSKNVIVGGNAAANPPDNFFPPSLDKVGFVDLTRGNYRLADSSRYRRTGLDGRDAGVDVDALSAAMAGTPGRASQRQATQR